MSNPIPEKLQDFRAYIGDKATDLLGTVDVTLPKIEFETAELKGAGIAGTLDSPNVGFTKSMTCEITFRTVTENLIKLAAPESHHLSFYGAVQVNDAGNGKLLSKQCKCVVKTLPKTVDTGKFSSGEAMESKTEMEVYYYQLTYDGNSVVEVDKLNHIYKVNDTDYLSEIRANMGLGA